MRKLVVGLCSIALASAAAGCIGVSGDTVRPDVPTLGEELQDLQEARESGAIDRQEYQRAKQRLLAEPRRSGRAED